MRKSFAGRSGLGRSSLAAATVWLLAAGAMPAARALEAPSPASLGRSIFHDASLQVPRLDDAEIDDLIAFLSTLTDGYDAATGTADPARDLASP